MNTTIDLETVSSFLRTVKKEVVRGNYVLKKRNNIDIGTKIINEREALLDLSLSPKGARALILELRPDECIDISRDHDKLRDFNSEIFEFITYVNDIKTYIKLTMNEEMIICLSFHRSRF